MTEIIFFTAAVIAGWFCALGDFDVGILIILALLCAAIFI